MKMLELDFYICYCENEKSFVLFPIFEKLNGRRKGKMHRDSKTKTVFFNIVPIFWNDSVP